MDEIAGPLAVRKRPTTCKLYCSRTLENWSHVSYAWNHDREKGVATKPSPAPNGSRSRRRLGLLGMGVGSRSRHTVRFCPKDFPVEAIRELIHEKHADPCSETPGPSHAYSYATTQMVRNQLVLPQPPTQLKQIKLLHQKIRGPCSEITGLTYTVIKPSICAQQLGWARDRGYHDKVKFTFAPYLISAGLNDDEFVSS